MSTGEILSSNSISENNDLINLIVEINILSNNNRYILSLEDIDRSDIWSSRYYSNSQISKDCLLNVIDGIIESYGRILIMTCNDPSFINKFPAIQRPGRIDQSIKIDNCDADQIKRLIKKFYNKTLVETPIITEDISPAEFIKLMQQYSNDFEFIKNNITNIGPHLLTNDSVEPNILNKKKNKNNDNLNVNVNKIKMELKNLNSSIKWQQRTIDSKTKFIEKMKVKIPKVEEKMNNAKKKITEKKQLIKERNKKQNQLDKIKNSNKNKHKHNLRSKNK